MFVFLKSFSKQGDHFQGWSGVQKYHCERLSSMIIIAAQIIRIFSLFFCRCLPVIFKSVYLVEIIKSY